MNDELKEENWRETQKSLPNGRICPICKKICLRNFEQHLKIHGLSKLDYIFLRDNITENPKCANPKCNNKVVISVNDGGWNLNTYCSSSCFISQRNKSENNPFKIRDENGISLSKRMVLEGTNTFVKKDSQGRSFQQKRVQEGIHNFVTVDDNGFNLQQRRVIEGTHNFLYNDDPEHNEEIYNKCIKNGLLRTRSSIWGYISYLTFKNGITKLMRSSWEPWLAIWLDIQNIPFEWESVHLYSERDNHTYTPDCRRLDTNELLEVKGYNHNNYDKDHIRELTIKAGYKDLIMFYEEDINNIYLELRDKYHLNIEPHKKLIFSRFAPKLDYNHLINNSSGY